MKEEENSSPSSNFLFLEESIDLTGVSKSTSSRRKSSEPSCSMPSTIPWVAIGEETASKALSTDIGLGIAGGELVEPGKGTTTIGPGPTEGEAYVLIVPIVGIRG